MDSRPGSDAQMGYVNVKLQDILEANSKQQDWFPLSACDTGRVRITAQWKGLSMSGAINGAGIYTPPIGLLRLFIKRGVDLKNVEALTGGKSDPYVRVHSNGIVLARTLVVNNECVVLARLADMCDALGQTRSSLGRDPLRTRSRPESQVRHGSHGLSGQGQGSHARLGRLYHHLSTPRGHRFDHGAMGLYRSFVGAESLARFRGQEGHQG